MKIIDKLRKNEAEGRLSVSLEFFPAKTEAGVDNLLQRIEHMGLTLAPTFVTLTWRSVFKARSPPPEHADGSTMNDFNPRASRAGRGSVAQDRRDRAEALRHGRSAAPDVPPSQGARGGRLGLWPLMQRVCRCRRTSGACCATRERRASRTSWPCAATLPSARSRRVARRSSPSPSPSWLVLIAHAQWKPTPGGFSNAVELVRLIREEHGEGRRRPHTRPRHARPPAGGSGDYFCIAVAAYPEVHTETWNHPDLPPSNQSRALDLQRLKEKVDAGADFIITQFFYDTDTTINFIKAGTSRPRARITSLACVASACGSRCTCAHTACRGSLRTHACTCAC